MKMPMLSNRGKKMTKNSSPLINVSKSCENGINGSNVFQGCFLHLITEVSNFNIICLRSKIGKNILYRDSKYKKGNYLLLY